MRADNDILKELKEISLLMAAYSNNNSFAIPEGYFESLSDLVLVNVKEELSLNIGSEVFKIPGGYFDNLSALILEKVKIADDTEEELNVLSPLLFSIQHINVFNVPKDYFNNIQGIVLKSLHKPQAQVVRTPAFRLIFKYAAAAVITAIISLSVYKYIENPFLTISVHYTALTPFIEKGKSMNEQQFNEELKVLSNEDISAYLEKNGIEEDISSILHNLKEDALPNKDDYFLDEKTLENYLGSIEIKK